VKTFTLSRLLSLLAILLVGGLTLTRVLADASSMKNFIATSNFAVMGGSTITNTGSSVINGDIGLSPGTSITGFPPGTLTGTMHAGDSGAATAQTQLTAAYNSAAGQTPVTTIPTELGGTTVLPGVYTAASGTFGITGTLTLNAQNNPDAIFVFKTATTLITATNSTVVLINGAQSCNIFWQVGSSATLGTTSHLEGSVLAAQSITDNGGSTINGRLLALNAAVTLNNTNVTKQLCAAPVSSSSSSSTQGTLTGGGGPTWNPTPAPVVITPAPVVAPVVVSAPTPVAAHVVIPKLPNTGIGPDAAEAL
jgi:hypothetical protein